MMLSAATLMPGQMAAIHVVDICRDWLGPIKCVVCKRAPYITQLFVKQHQQRPKYYRPSLNKMDIKRNNSNNSNNDSNNETNKTKEKKDADRKNVKNAIIELRAVIRAVLCACVWCCLLVVRCCCFYYLLMT